MRLASVLGSLVVAILGFTQAQSHAAFAPVLLTIDDSNPSAVVITATSSNALGNFSGNTAAEGVDLLSFFTVDESGMSGGQFAGGTLQGGGDGVAYDSVKSDNDPASGGLNVDLNLYLSLASSGSGNTETFSSSQTAFTGTWTIDLASLGVDVSDLPTAGTAGSLISGDSANPGQILGGWQVAAVPEPGTLGLVTLGAAFLGLARRHLR